VPVWWVMAVGGVGAGVWWVTTVRGV
jgi:hypothetical protein